MGIIEEARTLRELIKEISANIEDKTLAIATSKYFEVWTPGKYQTGDIRTHPATGAPKECITAHNSAINTDWTMDVASLWKPYHSRKKEYALPWEAPTGAHDMYKTGEYMVWTDGGIYLCLSDTVYSPVDYSQAWEMVEE